MKNCAYIYILQNLCIIIDVSFRILICEIAYYMLGGLARPKLLLHPPPPQHTHTHFKVYSWIGSNMKASFEKSQTKAFNCHMHPNKSATLGFQKVSPLAT